jgi:hypothetical protein
MQVSNTTDQGTRYTVTSGTTVPPITPPSGALIQGQLQPGEAREIEPIGKGPWKVMFIPEEGDRAVVTVRNPCDCVILQEDADGLRCEVMAPATA